MLRTGTIYGVNGPVIYLKGNTGFKMSEMVYVGKERLVGEVIALDKDKTTIQVFEETTGCVRERLLRLLEMPSPYPSLREFSIIYLTVLNVR